MSDPVFFRPPSRVLPLITLGAALVLACVVAGEPPAAGAAGAKPAAKAAAAPRDSMARLKAAVDKDSTNAQAQYRYGLGLLDNDRPLEATRAFTAAVKSKPEFLEAWVNLGAANDAIGNGSFARGAYAQALVLRKDDEIALCRMASSFYAGGQKDSAMTVLRQTLAAHPRSHCSYFTLGVAFADGGMFREAIAAWEKVAEFAPGSLEAESATESVRLLKEYLGADSVRVATAGKPGVPPGSGGSPVPIAGGDMKSVTPAPALDAHGHSTSDGHKH